MSYNLDGKIANQKPRVVFNSGNSQPICENCKTLVDNPEQGTFAPIKGNLEYEVLRDGENPEEAEYAPWCVEPWRGETLVPEEIYNTPLFWAMTEDE